MNPIFSNCSNFSLSTLHLRHTLAMFICILIMSPHALANDTSLTEALTRCAQQSNSLQRLVCYDRISASLNGYTADVPPVAPHQQTKTVSVAPPKQIAEADSFGKTVQTDDSMTATIASVAMGRNNLMTITLVNGQVWKQTKSEDRARLEAQQVVTFEKGFFGAIYLSAEGSNRRIAVKRLK